MFQKRVTFVINILALLIFTWPEAVLAQRTGPDEPSPQLQAGSDPIAARLVVLYPANVRQGPGTGYPIIGGARPGDSFTIISRNSAGDWLQLEQGTEKGWIFAALGQTNVPTDQLPVAENITPPAASQLPQVATGTAAAVSQLQPASAAAGTFPIPSAPVTASVAVSEPLIFDTVVLDPDTRYPVRARKVVGWGYEIVDASTQYDLVLNRDVLGQVAHEFWGDKLFKAHPHGIRITLVDFNAPPECDFVCKSCPGQPTMHMPVTPLQTVKDWRGQCRTHSYQEGYGDGAGSMIWVGCAHYYAQRPDDGYAVFYDPQECFVAVQSAGEHLTDLLVSATTTAYNFWTVDTPWGATPEFDKSPFTPLLGQAYREGDQWRWRNPFLEVTSARR
jgi:hypothetical protein